MPRVNQINAGVVAVQLVQQNPRRKSLWIENTHAANDIYVGTGPAVLATTGWLIRPYGHISINHGDGDEPEKTYWVLASGANTRVAVMEQFGKPMRVIIVKVLQVDGIQEPPQPDPLPLYQHVIRSRSKGRSFGRGI